MKQITTLLILALALAGCQHQHLHVQNIGETEYPYAARYKNLQGSVNVKVSIGPDGKVENAEGSGAPDILVKAAEDNVKQWKFGPFPAVSEFPVEHTVTVKYTLEGKPQVVASPLIVKTFLPDRIEISTTPLLPDLMFGSTPPEKINPDLKANKK